MADLTLKCNPNPHAASCFGSAKNTSLKFIKMERFSMPVIEFMHDGLNLVISYILKAVPLVKHCLSKPLVFSFKSRCQE